ncbi:MAG: hypothetical protein HY583_02350 [Candidatus Omnitrophica bacterium]|nr:hypothetical protein [Candidatus Omnitrophota bacterium]
MKRSGFTVLLALLLTGCYETNFNFKTVVHQSGKIDREVQINGEGADRFLPPTGPRWEIKAAESKPAKLILGETQYHIHAIGHFAGPNQFTSDFRYNTPGLIADLTEEKHKALRDELQIPEPFGKEIGTENRIQLQKKRSLFSIEYHYTEMFEVRHLISILLYDLKKDIAESQIDLVNPKDESLVESQKNISKSEPQTPSRLGPDQIEALVQEKLREDILPKFQFHSEVTFPGKITSSNASQTHGETAIWDFRAADFENDFSIYTLHAVSKAPNFGALIALALAFLAIIIAVMYARQKKTGPS